ncbi:MAG: molecular chaperone TorD family protein [Hyphomicrobiaceae bacterium]|nr:molecular chaperone TorD family protein [Hyphomicrobiaceae bacterium]
MTSTPHHAREVHELSEEDRLRAQFYGMIAQFLSEPPSAERLKAGGLLTGDDTPLGAAVATFARVCARCDEVSASDEYHELFIGLGRGELLPFASYYLTGFLHEKPLAKLRQDMAELGIVQPEGVTEPEDHAASVLEAMSGLIDGRFGQPHSLSEQKKFFDAHIASWMPVFFRDLEGASASVLYASLAQVARHFLDIEADGFAFEAGNKAP